jgi:hypothetical protein
MNSDIIIDISIIGYIGCFYFKDDVSIINCSLFTLSIMNVFLFDKIDESKLNLEGNQKLIESLNNDFSKYNVIINKVRNNRSFFSGNNFTITIRRFDSYKEAKDFSDQFKDLI